MAVDQPIPPDADMLIFPPEPTPGAIGAFAKFEKLEQIRQLEQERHVRVWEIRAYISDHAPLAGGADAALGNPVEGERDSGLKANAVPVGRRTVCVSTGMAFGLERNVFHR